MINEVSSSNVDTELDASGDSPDWIELYNNTLGFINLDNYMLSDKRSDSAKWRFPSVNIAPGTFLRVFASGKDLVGPEVHTNFKLSSGGEYLRLSDDTGQLLDSLSIPALAPDDSYGRSPDGGPWAYFDVPTPGASNTNTAYLGYAERPVFNLNSGFYSAGFNLEIDNPNGAGVVYYTLTGDIPRDTSSVYSGAINVSKNSVISAFCVVPGYLDSRVRSEAYFIGTRNYLPTISISVPPYLMFSDSMGIYALGDSADPTYPYYGANFWQDWEVPVQLKYFTNDGQEAFGQLLGMKIHGGRVSRTNPQRSFRLLAKDKYGDGDIDYPLFPNKPHIESLKRFVLRNAGGDFSFAHMRDPLVHKASLEFDLNVDVSDYHPVAVYINGAYWGVMNVREKLDEHYLSDNYDVDTDDLDFLEEDTAVIIGSFSDFDTLWQYVLNYDMNDPVYFDPVATELDVNSFMDYFITQLYMNNTDWPQNNLKLWRERSSQYHPWRYLLFDLDGAYDLRGWTPVTDDALEGLLVKADNGNKHAQLFEALLENDSLRDYFLTRYADLMNTVFRPSEQLGLLERQRSILANEMVFHETRWSLNQERYNQEVSELIPEWMSDRPQIVRNQLENRYDLNGQVELSLNVYPPEAGKILVNTITPGETPWDGIYFDGVPVTLTAVPNQGFTFDFWKGIQSFDIDYNAQIKRNYTVDDHITAYFETYESPIDLTVYPNPLVNDMTLSFVLSDISDVSCKMFTVQGKEIESWSLGHLNAGKNVINLPLKPVNSGMYTIQLQTNDSRTSFKVFVK